MTKINSIIYLLLAGWTSIFGQQEKKSIQVMSRPLKDSILLRWAPTSFDLWQAANQTGYIVERFILLKNGEIQKQPKGIILTPQPLKPLPLNQWEPLSNKDEYIGVAAQAIYGETFEVSGQKGSGIMDIINKATEQENRFTFALFAADQSPLTAKASGLWYTDKDVRKGETYLYKVYLAGTVPFKTDTGYTYTGVDDYKKLPRPVNLNAYFSDRTVLLTWNKLGIDQYYNGFFIEKSADDGKTFLPVNKKAFVNPEQEKGDRYPFYFYIDSIQNNDQLFKYRVYGISPFGEKGPFSDTISGKGLEKVKDNPHIVTKEIIRDREVKLTWEFPKDKIKTISGFRILRSNNDETGYKAISENINAEDRVFTDKHPFTVNYYKVLAYKDGGLASISLPVMVQMPDSIPPDRPTGLIANTDTTGKLILKWKANKEPDIYGYRIYRANNKTEEFSQLTIAPITDTVFHDHINLKTLSKKICYQILAVDKRQNFSQFSDILEVERPDIIPPVAPLITDFLASDNGNKIIWVNSTSDDVIEHCVYRKTYDNNSWEKLACFKDTSIHSFNDSLAEPGSFYYYAIRAKDRSGLLSNVSRPLGCKTLSQTKVSKIELTGIPDRENKTIKITWKPVKDAAKYFLYRSIEGQPLALYINLDGEKTNFSDNKVLMNTTYSYSLKVQYKNNTSSVLSPIVQVKF